MESFTGSKRDHHRMAQAIWQFVSNTGGRHKIGLYHGDDTGHVLLYCNSKVIKIDFAVRESESYSFFVDDDFCNIHLTKEPGGGFTYAFEVDKETNTPLNQERKKEKKKYQKYTFAFVIGLIAVLFGFYFGMSSYQKTLASRNSGWAGAIYFPDSDVSKALHEQGIKTYATLTQTTDRGVLKFSFFAENGTEIINQISIQTDQLPILPNGFAPEQGDQYQIRYNKDRPEEHCIDFMAPSEQQVGRFFGRALAVEGRNGLGESRNICVLRTILEESGWEQLQHVINQYVPEIMNKTHNTNSYARLMRTPALEKAIKASCWDK
jgi:Fas apoptotic inhibitory molecule (FAIM1)